jgi:hypothetical protein
VTLRLARPALSSALEPLDNLRLAEPHTPTDPEVRQLPASAQSTIVPAAKPSSSAIWRAVSGDSVTA